MIDSGGRFLLSSRNLIARDDDTIAFSCVRASSSCNEVASMRKTITRERAALAVVEKALSKVLTQLALAQSTMRVCDKPSS
jgi:hypothetical protein